MKNLYFFVLFIALFASLGTHAQKLIAVQNNTTPFFYTSLDSAIVHAVDGDTIFLPGGNFPLGNTTIAKQLHIIGVGHHPDSSIATNPTNIVPASPLKILTGASGGSIIGIRLFGNYTPINFGTSNSNSNINGFTIGNCYLGAIYISYGGESNILFYGNILGPLSATTSFYSHNRFYNNVFKDYIFIGSDMYFSNNIFLYSSHNSGYVIANASYSQFENNVFLPSSVIYTNTTSYYNNFRNNIFVSNYSFPYGTNTGSNNIINQAASSIFVNQSGSTFSYSDDYHLQPTSPGKNAGRDGTDIGIYGGAYPWKDGSIPFNPHFQKVVVSPTTNTSGNLNVNIQVEAQDR